MNYAAYKELKGLFKADGECHCSQSKSYMINVKNVKPELVQLKFHMPTVSGNIQCVV